MNFKIRIIYKINKPRALEAPAPYPKSQTAQAAQVLPQNNTQLFY